MPSRAVLTFILTISFMFPVAAGVQRWTYEKESDPFSGGIKVTASHTISRRSIVFVFCDTAEKGLELRSLAGWEATPDLYSRKPEVAVAIDGKILLEGVKGSAGACGENIACVSSRLDYKNSLTLLDAFKVAKKQIAIKDGISDRPFLLSARGSTKTAKALLKCLKKQDHPEPDTST